jgi:prophage regulatory protein
MSATGMGRSWIYQSIKNGSFPKPITISGAHAVAWVEHEIQEWIELRIATNHEAEFQNGMPDVNVLVNRRKRAESPPAWAKDTRAIAEEINWKNEGKLRGQREKNDLLWLKVYGGLLVFLTVVFTMLFVASLGIWAGHHLMPVYYAWLNESQLSKIQSIIFSGSIGGVVATILQKQLHLAK